MIRRTAMVILCLPQQTNTFSKSATKTVETTEDNSNKNIFKKQPPDVFYKKVFLNIFFKKSFLSKIHRKTPVPKSLFQSLQPATLLKRHFNTGVFWTVLRIF